MAGIADLATDGAPSTFAILTAPARPPIAAVHDRMPVLLTREGARRLLREPAPRSVAGEPVPIAQRSVSPRCNAVTNDDPACLAPANDTDAPATGKQLRLF
jgi:putative SOS response-associated peptidase YedK